VADTLFDLDNDYKKLSIARDHAAYRALGAIDAAICYCRNGDAVIALNILTKARAQYERANQKLQDAFASTSKKENTDAVQTSN